MARNIEHKTWPAEAALIRGARRCGPRRIAVSVSPQIARRAEGAAVIDGKGLKVERAFEAIAHVVPVFFDAELPVISDFHARNGGVVVASAGAPVRRGGGPFE